jgi:hypothetical protein
MKTKDLIHLNDALNAGKIRQNWQTQSKMRTPIKRSILEPNTMNKKRKKSGIMGTRFECRLKELFL